MDHREPASSKTGKIFIIFFFFPDKSFFCLLKYHNDSSTIPVAFIVKFWSTSIEMTSSDTMKESTKSNWTPFSKVEFNYACAFVYSEHGYATMTINIEGQRFSTQNSQFPYINGTFQNGNSLIIIIPVVI